MINDVAAIRAINEASKASENWTLVKACDNSEEAGNSRLDFEEVIWDEDIPVIAETMRKAGVTEFTISVRQGNLIDIMAAFQELGISIRGMVVINTRFHKGVPAVLMQVA